MFDANNDIGIHLLEVDDAEPLAGEIFKRSFNQSIPNFPKHFVLLATNEHSQSITLGYVHFTQFQNFYLCGGMCVNTRALRHLPKHIRKQLSELGGVAYHMLSNSINSLNDCDVIFGHVGHKGAYKIDLAVGFIETDYKHLLAYWKTELSEEEKNKVIRTARAFEPF